MQFDHTVQTWRAGDPFFALATPLDVAGSAPAPDAARQAPDKAVRLFIDTAAEHGTRCETRRHSGFPGSPGFRHPHESESRWFDAGTVDRAVEKSR